MLLELGIKHRYTRPYRPQTNGKVERFWRTLDDDVIEGATFDNLDHFANELFEYLIYYNNHRPHQALGRANTKGLRCYQDQHNPISELVNIAQLRAKRSNPACRKRESWIASSLRSSQ